MDITLDPMNTCTKCGSTRFNLWKRCMDCRNSRAQIRAERMKRNGGSHSVYQWQALLAATPICPDCMRPWESIPLRPDERYKQTWTKDHIVPIVEGGSNAISNIRPLCYLCNFRRHTKPLPPAIAKAPMTKLQYTVKRGAAIGTVLASHRHEDGSFVVSLTRFEKDYIRVRTESELPTWLAKGYSLRMSNQSSKSHRSPSLISPGSIVITGV